MSITDVNTAPGWTPASFPNQVFTNIVNTHRQFTIIMNPHRRNQWLLYNDTLASVEVISFAWPSDIVSPTTGASRSILKSLLNPKTENLIMSLRSDIVSFWFWGYRGNLRTELQAPVAQLPSPVYKGYGSSASALHRHGVCFGFVCKWIEHAPNRKKSLHVKHEKFKFSRKTKRYAKEKKNFGTRTQGF